MERLTKDIDKCRVCDMRSQCSHLMAPEHFREPCTDKQIYDQLRNYELTGLTPEEIKNIKECQSNIVKFVTEKKNLEQKYSTPLEMYDKKQKELETWKRDAIESKAKLGEIQILVYGK